MTAMPRRRPRAAPALETVADIGPPARLRRGDVEVTDAADPERPNVTIRRAKVRYHYDTLYARGGLTYGEREAAERYAKTCELAAGGRDGQQERVDGGRRDHSPTQTQLAALVSLRAVYRVLGLDASALLDLYCRDNIPAAEVARRRRETEAATLGRIRAALTRAAEHWGLT